MAVCKKSNSSNMSHHQRISENSGKSEKIVSKAFSYTRLSKEDGDKTESNSIANQKKLIRDYVRKREDMELVGEFSDDGYTGTNFERPQFTNMLDAIRRGEADCIIVKDLSRFGRDYIDSGRYIQKIFPMLNIRFIAINDNIDSAYGNQADDLVIPFKNLINDSYCRDLSMKLRKQFRVQRANGEFIGSYTAYGYSKSKADKHKLEIDQEAAEVVRDIFLMKLQGYSQSQIAGHLNRLGIPAPAEYKRQQGMNYQSGFQVRAKSQWTTVTITRILKNRVYTGRLEQGKRGTPNYKVKRMMERKPEDWIVVENNHEPIIEELVFQAVERSMECDTRISQNGTVRPLSGVLYCGDCNSPMVTRSVIRGKRKFSYYVCGTNKYGNGCTSHNFSVPKLEEKILKAVQLHMEVISDIRAALDGDGEDRLRTHRMRKMEYRIEQKEKEIGENREYQLRLYESLVDGMITNEEYGRLRQKYTQRIQEGEETVRQLREELDGIGAGISGECSWMDSFLKYREVTELTRDLVLTVIDRIYVYEGKSIRVQFNFRDELKELEEFMEETAKEAG